MYTFAILLIVSFLGTYYVLPHSIRKLSENGYLVKDMYKSDTPSIPTNAGMILVFTTFISISLVPLFVRVISFISPAEFEVTDLSETNLAFLLVVSIYALYGLVDDLVDIGRLLKLFLPVTFAYPLISVIIPSSIWIPILGMQSLDDFLIWDVTKADIFRVIIIPIYVMVVANLVNMHSGYNGLQAGLSLILLSTLCLKSYLDGILNNILPAASILGAMTAFYYFNKFPSKVFEGNIGSLFFGSVIGSIIVIQEYWWFGFFILIPHSINFVLWLVWLYMMWVNPKLYTNKDGRHTKFGKIRPDYTIKVPNPLTLKWIPNYFFRLKENESTYISFCITLIFCLFGLYFI